ncbi:phospholipase D-like domain-containing protein [Fodinibius saliphilus]|uniref:phospholipase D-like domain-containing protein n=1 Tax=Fodinibius saliphilus TaxID=1920650 RepID=UPI001BB2B48F|nr:phospholipase D-like domain-containing protein [Fodinibius saliphilus]
MLLLFLVVSLCGHTQTVHSDTSNVEWIKVYFNMPADYSVAQPANMSNSNVDLVGTLESLIGSAKHSVDLAIYDLEHIRIGEALAEAKQRGVRVRVVTDNYNRTDAKEIDSTMWAVLREADISSIDDDGDVYNADGGIADYSLTNSGADMHHKFAVIDAKSSSKQDDVVWTGSTNMTYTGVYNTNNTIIIKDSGIAEAYLQEFEQMWGGDDNLPNPDRALFHKDKKEVSNHYYYVGGTKVEVFFSPINRDGTKPSIMKRLVEVIREESQHDVVFQAFAITPFIPLSRTIWKRSATGEISLNGAIDPMFYYRYKSKGDIWASREAKLSNRLILPANEMRKLHHKVMLVDANHPDSTDQGITIAGSYNFSKNAEVNNDENLLIIHSDYITNQYYQDFCGVIRRAQGKAPIPSPPLDSEKWYTVKEVSDGSQFAVEIAPGFQYNVRLLGVDVPRLYAGRDSSEYYSAEAAEYMRNLISGKKVRLQGPTREVPNTRYGAFYAYITLKNHDKTISLNKRMLRRGLGDFSNFLVQHPDSVNAFKKYVKEAKKKKKGIWKQSEKVGKRYLRAKIVGLQAKPSDAFPININTADEALLDLLPGVGPAYAKRIVTYRKKHGQFIDIDQLQNIRGIGPKTLQKLRPNVVIE